MLQIKTVSCSFQEILLQSAALSLITHNNRHIAAFTQPVQQGPVAPQMFHPNNN